MADSSCIPNDDDTKPTASSSDPCSDHNKQESETAAATTTTTTLIAKDSEEVVVVTSPPAVSPTENAVVASLKRKEIMEHHHASANSSGAAKQARCSNREDSPLSRATTAAVVATNNTTTTSTTTTANNNNNNNNTEVLDLAMTLGITPQSRLEVQWDIVDDETGVSRTHWWGATVLDYDGRTEDGVAVRVLDYDPYPDGGFPERSQEDVIFVGGNSLFNLTTDSVLHFRREGIDDEEDEDETVVFKGEDGIRDIVNGILSQVMQNNSERWRGLTAAQQARVAEVVATQKERLIEALMARPGEVITSSVMKDILEQTLGPIRRAG